MYLVDNTSLRERCHQWAHRRCGFDQYEYAVIESELKDDPNWPPVNSKAIDLATVFQRLESSGTGNGTESSTQNGGVGILVVGFVSVLVVTMFPETILLKYGIFYYFGCNIYFSSA
jgi:hypothetical protein